jgi:hypothetical protein
MVLACLRIAKNVSVFEVRAGRLNRGKGTALVRLGERQILGVLGVDLKEEVPIGRFLW